ncbi:MAG: phosphoglycerate dehydrogenase [Acidobacteriota bacterium]|nr:phosphoglycerate dehydrogenase [Acidobacteriota bacterium]
MPEIKIFVADDVNEGGLEPLRSAGFEVEKRTGLKGEELAGAVTGCDGLIVRSETKVTAELLESAGRLRVIGRAGVGVDNIDVAAATQRGVVVMNAPDGNTMTTAEHTLALLLALARRVPQGNASLRAGRWERKRFVGTELRGKTLGIVGLGRIGRVVASRARGFEMRVVAFDPFVAPEQVRDAEIELAPLEEVCARADFLTVHTPLTPETRGIVGAKEFAWMKSGVYVINCARGGLVDERALHAAIREGRVAGAALDVFEEEPPAADNPLLALEEVIATPHLGASTKEAQEGVAVIVAEQMRDFFQTGAVRGAVNVPVLSGYDSFVLRPYLDLAERLGRFQAQLIDKPVREVWIECAGETMQLNTEIVRRAFLVGLLHDVSTRVTIVNADSIINERGIVVRHSHVYGVSATSAPAMRTGVLTTSEEHVVAGELFGQAREGRATEIDGLPIEAILAGHMIVTHSIDVPGVIGLVGMILGKEGINISRFHLGRRERGGEAIAVIETDAPPGKSTLNKLRAAQQIISAWHIVLT